MKTALDFVVVLTVSLVIFPALAETPPVPGVFRPGEIRNAIDGKPINAHGGGVLFHEGVYYWFGEHKIEGETGNSAMVGVHCYSSTDLYRWKDEGVALAVSEEAGHDIEKGCILERPKVLHSAATGKFVMWFHLELKATGYKSARSGVAVSDTPTGPYRYVESLRPCAGHWPMNVPEEWKRPLSEAEEKRIVDLKLGGGPHPGYPKNLIFRRDFQGGQMARDMTLFRDDDGKSYHIYSSEENGTLHIAELTDDLFKHTGRYVRVLPGEFNEAPAIFKRRGKYWLFASGCTGWSPNPARLAVADSIWGPWKTLGNPCRGTDEQKGDTFKSQSTFVLKVEGQPDAWIFLADRWNPKNAIDGRYVWLPVEFDADVPFLRWHEQWTLDMFSHENSTTSAYPKARKSEQEDEYFGTKIADPYRWMESDSPELARWIEAENRITHAYLETIPFRDALRKRLTELVDYPKHSLPWTRAGRRFYFKNTGLQNQSVLYVVDRPGGEPRVLLDPNTLSEDGTVSLQSAVVSRDGKYLACAIARSGSDWSEIKVLDIATGRERDDHLRWIKFSRIAWAGDGFYYSRYDAPPEGEKLTAKNENHKVCFHRLGTPQEEDLLVREDKEHPLRTRRASTDKEQRYLFLSESDSTYGNSLAYRQLDARGQLDTPFVPVVSDFDSEQEVIAVLDDVFYALTDREAPNTRLVAIDPKNPAPERWKDVIPETETLLADVRCIGGKFVATYLKDAAHEAFVFDRTGKLLRDIELPTLGIVGFSGDKDETEYFESFTSYTYPTVIYRYDIATGDREELFPSGIDFRGDDYVVERTWYENGDGKKVPVFLTYKKGLKRDGSNPTLLYGYGGFNISMRPSFSAYRLPFLENGGIFAVAILRGGGEYGETWYKSGTKMQKQNVFDDFIAAAEHLIAEKYTSPRKLAVQGGSNGGLLVGAVVTQRPELYRAAVPAVGVLDMLRYHKFTIGWAWARDYGTSEESREMFEYLHGYSPLHNIRSGVDYPALLITTSDHDDRVVPAHSFKFAATLQEKSTSTNPAYIRIETKAGHGAGKPVSKIIDESTDVWAFLMDRLGMSFKSE